MTRFKFYRKDNYIVVVNELTQETQYGFVKEVRVDKSNLDKASYRIFNVKDFDDKNSLVIDQLLKEDGTPYTQTEFETFYTQNTGNFNGGGSAPGVQSVTGSGVDNTDPQNPIITGLSQESSIQDLMDNDVKTGSIDSGNTTMQLFSGDNTSRTFGVNISDGGSEAGGISITKSTFSAFAAGGYNHFDIGSTNIALVGEITGTGAIGGLVINSGSVNLTQTAPGFGTTSVKFNTPVTGTILNFPAYAESGEYTIATTSDTATIEIIEDNIYIITDQPPNLMLTYTTAASNITTLPDPTLNAGKIIFFTNKLVGVVTLNSILGGNDIWDGGVLTNTYPVPSGTVTRLICDGLTYNVL